VSLAPENFGALYADGIAYASARKDEQTAAKLIASLASLKLAVSPEVRAAVYYQLFSSERSKLQGSA